MENTNKPASKNNSTEELDAEVSRLARKRDAAKPGPDYDAADRELEAAIDKLPGSYGA